MNNELNKTITIKLGLETEIRGIEVKQDQIMGEIKTERNDYIGENFEDAADVVKTFGGALNKGESPDAEGELPEPKELGEFVAGRSEKKGMVLRLFDTIKSQLGKIPELKALKAEKQEKRNELEQVNKKIDQLKKGMDAL